MLLWCALFVLPVGSSLAGTDLLGRVVILGERDTDTPRPLPDTAVAIQGAGETRTNPRGRFHLLLPFDPGVAVIAEVDHPGHVIYHPYRGEFRLPAPTAGQPAKPVDIELLPQGSSRLMDDYTFKLFAEQLKHDALDEIRPEGSPAEIDFSRYLEDLGRRLGFSLQDIEKGLADWRARKQTDPDTDPYERGLAALTAQHFDEARRLFRQSRLSNESALLQDEQRLAKLQDQIAERRRLVIRDLRAEGQAAYLAYDFAAALNLFRQALARSDRAADPEGWAESLMDVATANYQIGIRTEGPAVQQRLAEAVAAYRAALEVYTRALLPQDWAMTQNNLGIALQEQGTRSGGEEGRRLLAEALDAFGGALEIYQAAGAGHYVQIIEHNIALTELFVSAESDPVAQFTLGALYARGQAVKQDDATAAQWFRKAAVRGHGQAQLVLGLMVLSGRGVDQDELSGYAWIHLSAENGVEDAIKLRGQLQAEMEPSKLQEAERLAERLLQVQGDNKAETRPGGNRPED